MQKNQNLYPEGKEAEKTKKSGKVIPALLTGLGSMILLAVILSGLILTVPKLFGFHAYTILSGSMEPALPIGSLVFVKETDPTGLSRGEVIMFTARDSKIVHRVVENRKEAKELITRGDANGIDDIMPRPYEDVIGKVRFSVPFLGKILSIYETQSGKITIFILIAAGVIFAQLGARMRGGRNHA